MNGKFDAELIKFIASSQEYLRAIGVDDDSAGAKLHQAARRVVWARYYSGDDGWDRLKKAIGQLEDIVGRPEREV